MRRPVFGILVTDRQGNAIPNSSPPGGGGTVWTAQVGGSQLTDLVDNNRSGATDGFISTDSFGEMNFLYPNDGTAEAWIDFGFGRYFIQSVDANDRIAVNETAIAALQVQAGGLTFVQATVPPAGAPGIVYIPTIP